MKDYKKSIETYIDMITRAANAVDKDEINNFLNTLEDARMKKQQIFIMGNGGSSSTASHFVCDFNKGLSYQIDDKPRYKFICLNDSLSTVNAYANDVSYDEVFVEQLKNYMGEGDIVIGISGSGNSKNVLKAIEYANANGGKTIAIVGYDGGTIGKAANSKVHVKVDNIQVVEDIHMMLDHLSLFAINNTL